MKLRQFPLLCLIIPAVICGCGDRRIAVVWNTDGGNGFVGFIDPQKPDEFTHPAIEVGKDSTLASHNGILFALSQAAGTISRIDPLAATLDNTINLGENSEPLDMVIVDSETAYVTRRLATGLLRVNLVNGESEEIVDLGAFADADGIPDLGTMIVHENRLFVQIRRENSDLVNRFEPPAYIAVIDLDTEELVDVDPSLEGVQAVELVGTSPKQGMQVVPESNRLFVSATGGFFDQGGIEVIDLDTLDSLGFVIAEADGFTGADLGAFVLVTPQRGYLVYSTDLDLSSHLLPFSLDEGVEVRPEMHVSVGYFVPSMAFVKESARLFVPDGESGSRGVHRFNTISNDSDSAGPLEVDGRPVDILVVDL